MKNILQREAHRPGFEIFEVNVPFTDFGVKVTELKHVLYRPNYAIPIRGLNHVGGTRKKSISKQLWMTPT